ncbi:MAG: hypothetical protein V3581_04630 [Candidatus Cardinium sp.]|uniref:hypothetical protein n=1 Tax=Cardinium endosymbiont of Dermatophagoides farinae TaxID=2597823 RepID=UPI0011822083|nr:hypothetical protein [Cardinium endosymbiont of Dermatophagoides farinae]TSJ81103.1 hypothetical protein FPG78_03760 [Cardinium endosymbiont of Dermatophagoides farinae]UWW97145.1 MAG: hypothetical protein NMK33_01075 [Candidatus Cardinium sp.]
MKEKEDQGTTTDTDKSIETRKILAVLPISMIEKIQDYCYWKNMTQKEFLYQAVAAFLKGKKIESRPDSVKHRDEFLRKRKAKKNNIP